MFNMYMLLIIYVTDAGVDKEVMLSPPPPSRWLE